jgi:hypothetical protein
MSATWRKERSTVETNEIMKTAAYRSESWCWRQLHAADTCSKTRHVPFLCVKTSHMYIKISSSLDDVMSSTRKDVIRRRHVLLRCADSNLNHEWSKTASFVSCLDACLDAVGVRPPLELHFPLLGPLMSFICTTVRHSPRPAKISTSHRPSWEVNSHSFSQEIRRLLRNLKVHYTVHKSQVPDLILR